MSVQYSILFITSQYLTLLWYKYSNTNSRCALFQHSKSRKCLFFLKGTRAFETSSLCPNKKAKVPVYSPDERVENFVIKTSLPNVCNNQQLVQYIKNLADYTAKVLFVGSLFANFIFIKLLDDDQAIPIIEQSLFTNIFAVMTGNGKKAPHYLKEYFTLFCELTTIDRDSLKSINYSIILSIAGKQYEILVKNHIHETHERRSIMHFLNMMYDNNSSNCCKDLPVASRKALAYFIYKQKQGSEPSWPSSVPCNNYYKKIAESIANMWSKYQPDQYDSDTLYSKPHLFFKWFYFLSQEVQKKAFIMENVPSRVVSKAYVYRKLRELPFTDVLNKKKSLIL
ncbi:uncharacterized protein RHIMIDRAFT_310421 [Rhizopus microsporus ATCC 52813]|uniref:Uncharacterized protein n=1 Tax=Rhizopus microsporus ATCC 52813 TaxID=1340429 RepID=A0A2G4T9Z0_RHIZD|nr:uncharacterized protein RHIMIDRAFT_310421 [Rhizopus microsporus ATCC 52813]PHZ17818.1 hypothetical protein RHIMIDRAFT_310421 [Rhizopus microsporus ATCC 52813]